MPSAPNFSSQAAVHYNDYNIVLEHNTASAARLCLNSLFFSAMSSVFTWKKFITGQTDQTDSKHRGLLTEPACFVFISMKTAWRVGRVGEGIVGVGSLSIRLTAFGIKKVSLFMVIIMHIMVHFKAFHMTTALSSLREMGPFPDKVPQVTNLSS